MEKHIIAITGPSGSGKTTLANNLRDRNSIIIPYHVTTRNRRADDVDGFYRYFSHELYREKFENGEFLISSGDGPTVDKKYGNFYGLLREDCENAWLINDKIIAIVSYKDILRLKELSQYYNVGIINLAYKNIDLSMRDRLLEDKRRNSTIDEVVRRVDCAKSDRDLYWELVQKYASNTIFTDECTSEETYDRACDTLKLIRERKD